MTQTTNADLEKIWDYDDPVASELRFRELLPSAHRSEDTSYLVVLLTQIARTQGLQRNFDAAQTTLDTAESLLTHDMTRPRVRYLLERGRVFNSSGHPDTSTPYFLEAWQLASAAGEDFHAVDAAHMLAIVGSPEKQLEWNQRAMDLAEGSKDPRARNWLGSLYNNLGWTYHDMGHYDEALQTFKKGLECRLRQGQPREARIAAWTVARALRSLGRNDEAIKIQRDNLRLADEAGEPDGFIQEELGECLLALGKDDEARPFLAQAYAILSHDPWLREGEAERLERLRKLGGATG